jgi:hypothetical protein
MARICSECRQRRCRDLMLHTVSSCVCQSCSFLTSRRNVSWYGRFFQQLAQSNVSCLAELAQRLLCSRTMLFDCSFLKTQSRVFFPHCSSSALFPPTYISDLALLYMMLFSDNITILVAKKTPPSWFRRDRSYGSFDVKLNLAHGLCQNIPPDMGVPA